MAPSDGVIPRILCCGAAVVQIVLLHFHLPPSGTRRAWKAEREREQKRDIPHLSPSSEKIVRRGSADQTRTAGTNSKHIFNVVFSCRSEVIIIFVYKPDCGFNHHSFYGPSSPNLVM